MIVITGASDGLGLQLAKLYKESGKKVINISRRQCEFADTNINCDLTKHEDIKKAAEQINNSNDKIEALINCAGILSVQKLEDIDDDELHRLLVTNVEGMILLTSKLATKIKEDEADILNVSSTVGTKAYADQAGYGASKWAVRGFSANLQVEFKDTPTRVISFCPGGFESKIFEKATGEKNGDFSHWMKPEDLAKFVKSILDLPKNMEVSEIVVNRKSIM